MADNLESVKKYLTIHWGVFNILCSFKLPFLIFYAQLSHIFLIICLLISTIITHSTQSTNIFTINISKELLKINRPVRSFVQHIIISAESLGIDSPAGQIGFRATNDSSSLRRFVGASLPRYLAAEIGPATCNRLWRNTASIMKIFYLI